MSRSLRLRLGTIVARCWVVPLIACGSSQDGAHGHDGESSHASHAAQVRAELDPVTRAAGLLAREGCSSDPTNDPARQPVPTWSVRREAGGNSMPAVFDVVLYTAHPDDEAMYVGGTMGRLVGAGRRVGFVTLSHGEGGRLLERAADGTSVERRDYPRSHVIEVRDREIADAAGRARVAFAHVYPGDADVDYAWTTSCEDTLVHWQATLPDGIVGALRRLVADLRVRRPRVVITLDPHDDPQASHHGHHKAAGVLVEAAARLAADPRVRDGAEPHVIEELLTCAPQGLPIDQTVSVPVDVSARLRMLSAYASQFLPETLAVDPVAQRPNEQFVLRWRATGAPATREGSRLLDLVRGVP